MDSADCHSNATTCIEMSNRATERQEQAVLLELARSWMELAWQLESDPDCYRYPRLLGFSATGRTAHLRTPLSGGPASRRDRRAANGTT
jgi:hypothetical protein